MPLTPWNSDSSGATGSERSGGLPGQQQLPRVPHGRDHEGKGSGPADRGLPWVTEILRDQTGLWIRAHDLRRTLASEIFGTTQNVARWKSPGTWVEAGDDPRLYPVRGGSIAPLVWSPGEAVEADDWAGFGTDTQAGVGDSAGESGGGNGDFERSGHSGGGLAGPHQ